MAGASGVLLACAGFVAAGALRSPESIRPVFNPESDSILIWASGKTGRPCTIQHDATSGRAIHTHRNDIAMDFLQTFRPARTWLIITTRNVFDALPSYYFQAAASDGSPLYGTRETFLALTLKDQMEHFHAYVLPELVGKLHYQGMANYTKIGIDFSAHPFDFQKKLLQFQHIWDSLLLEVLVVRLEDAAHWEEIMQPYFPGFKIIPERLSADSAYATAYKQFRHVLEYDDDETRALLETKAMTNFYLPELEAERSRSLMWQKSDVQACDLAGEEEVVHNPLHPGC